MFWLRLLVGLARGIPQTLYVAAATIPATILFGCTDSLRFPLADYLKDQIRVEPNSLGFVGAPRRRELSHRRHILPCHFRWKVGGNEMIDVGARALASTTEAPLPRNQAVARRASAFRCPAAMSRNP
jgi:hypothetical protein